MQWFYERNDQLLNSPVNKTFEELLWMTNDEFRQWIIDMRKEVVRLWDVEGIPPRVGFNKDGIIAQARKMSLETPRLQVTQSISGSPQ